MNCCGLRIPLDPHMPCGTAADLWLLRYEVCNLKSVNPSVGSGDSDAATDSFKDGIIHAVRVEVLVSGRPVGC